MFLLLKAFDETDYVPVWNRGEIDGENLLKSKGKIKKCISDEKEKSDDTSFNQSFFLHIKKHQKILSKRTDRGN